MGSTQKDTRAGKSVEPNGTDGHDQALDIIYEFRRRGTQWQHIIGKHFVNIGLELTSFSATSAQKPNVVFSV